MNKKILVAAGVLIVAIAAVAGIYYAIKNDTNVQKNPGAQYGKTADGFEASVNRNEHIGVKQVLTKQAVESALGSKATQVSEPKESGVVTLGATKSETATFNFTTSAGDKNAFDVDARTYNSADDLGKATPFAGTDSEVISGLGDEAHYYLPYLPLLPDHQVALIVTKGKTSFKFSITQRVDKVAITDDEAKQLLLSAAKSADLDEVK